MELTLIITAFVAGLLMFLAPCTLPLVPAYIAFISGVRQEDVSTHKAKIVFNAIAFVSGFSVIFIMFGILAGLFATFVGPYRSVLTQIGGAFIILFGLMMLDVIKISSFFGNRSLPVPRYFTPGNPLSAFLIGATFALGWTPCVGPVLASVLLLTTATATALQGAFLLAIFSAGLSIPFLLTAVLYSRASVTIMRYAWASRLISSIGALFLIFIGFLLMTDNFGLTVEYGYKIFNALGLEGLFNHL